MIGGSAQIVSRRRRQARREAAKCWHRWRLAVTSGRRYCRHPSSPVADTDADTTHRPPPPLRAHPHAHQCSELHTHTHTHTPARTLHAPHSRTEFNFGDRDISNEWLTVSRKEINGFCEDNFNLGYKRNLSPILSVILFIVEVALPVNGLKFPRNSNWDANYLLTSDCL